MISSITQTAVLLGVIAVLLLAQTQPASAQTPGVAPPTSPASRDRCHRWLTGLKSAKTPKIRGKSLPHGCLMSRGEIAAIARGSAIRSAPAPVSMFESAPLPAQPAGSAGRAHLLALGVLSGLAFGSSVADAALPQSGRSGALLSLAGGAGGFISALYLFDRTAADPTFGPAVGAFATLGAGAALYAAGQGKVLDEQVVLPGTVGALVGAAGGVLLHRGLDPSRNASWNTATGAGWAGMLVAPLAGLLTDHGGERTAMTLSAMALGGFGAWHLGPHHTNRAAIGANVGGGIGLLTAQMLVGRGDSMQQTQALAHTALAGFGVGLGALIGWLVAPEGESK